jgi:hypothetical protein
LITGQLPWVVPSGAVRYFKARRHLGEFHLLQFCYASYQSLAKRLDLLF